MSSGVCEEYPEHRVYWSTFQSTRLKIEIDLKARSRIRAGINLKVSRGRGFRRFVGSRERCNIGVIRNDSGLLNRYTLCRWKNTVAPLYRLPTLPGALLWIKLCACMLRLSLSLSLSLFLPSISLYVSVCILYSFHRISTTGHAHHAAADPRDICHVIPGPKVWPGWWRHKSPTTLFHGVREYRARWHSHVENTSFFSLCIRHSQLTLFFEPLLLRERDIALGTFPPEFSIYKL